MGGDGGRYSVIFSLMERQQTGGPTYTIGYHDTNKCSGHNCLWKDNPVFLCFISTLILSLRVWNSLEWWKTGLSGGGRTKRGRKKGSVWTNASDSSGWADTDRFSFFFFCSGPCLSLSHSLSKYHYCTIRLLFIFRKDFIWAVVGLIRFLATVYTHPPSLPEEQNESRAAGQHSGFLHPDGRCERSQLGVPMLRPWSWVIYTLAKASKRQLRRKLLYIVW